MPGWAIERYDAVDSTQDVARARLQDRRVVVAGWQRAGRGRHGRPWRAPAGKALLFSVVLSPPAALAPILPLLAGVAVRDGIAATSGVDAELKWPNDVLAGDRKLAGILVERPPGPFAVLGVGINANLDPADLPGEFATSLLILSGQRTDLDALLTALLAQLDDWIGRATLDPAVVILAFRDRTRMLGQPVEVVLPDRTVRGVAEDITDTGALLVRTPTGGVESFIAGDVRRLRI
jgi:BirA family biotin operon repressor/biotin-[acetyl-CoA-carboxylase] ligase